jgi:hypothetical protein
VSEIQVKAKLDYMHLHKKLMNDLRAQGIDAKRYEKYYIGAGNTRREVLTIVCFGDAATHAPIPYVSTDGIFRVVEDGAIARIDTRAGEHIEESTVTIIFNSEDEAEKIVNTVRRLHYIDFDDETNHQQEKGVSQTGKYSKNHRMKTYLFDAMRYRGETITRQTIKSFLFSTTPEQVDKWSCKNKAFESWCIENWKMEGKEKLPQSERKKIIIGNNVKNFNLDTIWTWYKNELEK